MEVPPGRVERISDGGSDALRAILADLRTMKFNGILRTSVFRGDVPSQGLLVFRNGDGVLAEHRSAEAILGPDAVREILRDAASDKAQLEVRTYDYGHSSISLDHIQKSNGGAAIGGIGNVDRALGDVVERDSAARDAYMKELGTRRDEERRLMDRQDDLYRRKWEIEQEFQRSAMRQKELESLRAELAAVKEASGMLLHHLEEQREARDAELESQKRSLALEAEKARMEVEAQGRALAEHLAKVEERERELAAREGLIKDREAALQQRQHSTNP